MSRVLEQAQLLVGRLSLDDKVRLVRRLERETMSVRWQRLLSDIDRRRKGRRFTMAEIQREIDVVRARRH